MNNQKHGCKSQEHGGKSQEHGGKSQERTGETLGHTGEALGQEGALSPTVATERLYFLYLGDVDTEGAAIWTGWTFTTPERARIKGLGIAYEGKCCVTVLSIPRAPVVSASVAATVEKISFDQARAHYRYQTTRSTESTRSTEPARTLTQEEVLCPS